IVIVIMGILVAVAIPIYGAVTKNAEKKSCLANQNVIATNLSQYQMTGGANGELIPWATLVSEFNGVKVGAALPAPFRLLFKDGFPKCPTNNAEYKVKVTVDATGVGAMEVLCGDADAASLGHSPVATP
ncbi:MAG: hypothetical protein RR239_07935, partial [Oscillospiraceae bacterium]